MAPSNVRERSEPADLRIGTYPGSDPADDMRVAAMERWLGCTLDVQHAFTAWDATESGVRYLFDEVLSPIWSAGRVPLVTWEPFTPTPRATPDEVVARIVAGEYDEYLRRWFRRLDGWLRRSGQTSKPETALYIRLAHEPNGDWYPWCASDDGEEYVAMWRHIHDIFGECVSAVDRVAWLWTINHVDTGPVPFEALYPGDRYVDAVGVDGFNWGGTQEWSSWQSPASVFGGAFDRLAALTDAPVCVPEVGCTTTTSSGPDVSRKDEWIGAAMDYFEERDVGLVCWFDVDKETDWAIFGGERGLTNWSDPIDGRTYDVYPSFRCSLRP